MDDNFSIPEWLASLGLDNCAAAFARNNITPESLLSLTDSDLKECGIDTLGDRKRILVAIEKLKTGVGKPVMVSSSTAPASFVPTPQVFQVAAAESPASTEQEAPATPGTPKAPMGPVPAAPKPAVKPRRPLADRFGGRFLYISVIVHVAFGLFATWLVVQRIEAKRKLTFQGAKKGNNQALRTMEHKVQVTKKKNTMSAPTQAKRITTTGASARVAIPAMQMPTSSEVSASRMAGEGGPAIGASPTATLTVQGGGGGAIPFFGLRTRGSSATFVGAFYDFKQDNTGKPTEMALTASRGAVSTEEKPQNEMHAAEVKKLAKSGFSEQFLSKYYKAPIQLYAPQIYIPYMPADDCPKAFNVENKVKPKRWVAIYRAKVTAPESGRYRFVGFGDDYLVVRFNNRFVLDGGLVNVTGLPRKELWFLEGLPNNKDKDGKHNNGVDARVGETFEAVAGNSYPMDVLIGELPGGVMTGWILIQKLNADYEKDANGCPKLPVFKVGSSEVQTPAPGKGPKFAKDTPWSVWKANSTGSALDALREKH